MRFNDSIRKWGKFSFLDLLEVNEVPFTHLGGELSFPNDQAKMKASSIWNCLTGTYTIGNYGDNQHGRKS